MDVARITDSLRVGLMKPQAAGLSDREISGVATYVNSLALAPSAPASVPAQPEKISITGRALYVRNCITCHMPDGSSVAAGFPALRGSVVVRGEPSALIRAVLSGPTPAGASHAFGDTLSGAEAADLLAYVRQAFGGGATAIQPGDFPNSP